jgi:hypothetical protein
MSGFLHWSYNRDWDSFEVWDDDGKVRLTSETLRSMNDFLSDKAVVKTSLQDRIERLEKIMDGVIWQIYHGIGTNSDTDNWFRLVEGYRRSGAAQRTDKP